MPNHLISALPLPAYFSSPSGSIQGCNDAFFQLFDLSPVGDWSRSDCMERVPREFQEADRELNQRLDMGEDLVQGRIRFPAGTGIREVVLRKSPVHDSQGTRTGIVGLLSDITEQQEIQRALNHELQLRLAILDGVDAVVLVIDSDTGSIRIANGALKKLLGYDAHEVIGMPFSSLHLSQRDHDQFMEAASREVFHEHYILRHREGSMVPAEITMTRFTAGAGWPGARMLTIRDIAPFQKIEATLLQRQDELASILENIPGAVLKVASQGTVLYVSAAVARLLPVEPDDLVGRNLDDLSRYLPVDPATLHYFTDAIRTTGISRRVMEIEGPLHLPERTIMVRARIVPLQEEEEGTPAATLTLIQDMTEQRAMELSLRQSEEQVRQAQRLETVGQLAAGVAHDFNNILTAIQGYVYLLESPLVPDARERRYTEQIRLAVDRAARLTTQLLLFSRNEPSDLKPRNLNAIVEGMKKMLDRVIGERITIRLTLQEALPDIAADITKVEQVVMNLIINARDAMPNGGSIDITTTVLNRRQISTLPKEAEEPHGAGGTPSHFVVLSVHDNGEGMDEATRTRIFEPFFTTKGPGRGTGMGLAAVYGIMQEHMGWVEVESSPGVGTLFQVFFPAHTAAALGGGPQLRGDTTNGEEEPAGGAPSSSPAPQEALRVLLVEDQAAVARATTEGLAARGVAVHAVATLTAAREWLHHQETPPDVVVCDVVLPDGSGLDLLDGIPGPAGRPEVIFVSGFLSESPEMHRIHAQKLPFLSKPYRLEELYHRICSAGSP